MNNQDVSNFNIIESMRFLVEKKKKNAGILDVCEWSLSSKKEWK